MNFATKLKIASLLGKIEGTASFMNTAFTNPVNLSQPFLAQLSRCCLDIKAVKDEILEIVGNEISNEIVTSGLPDSFPG